MASGGSFLKDAGVGKSPAPTALRSPFPTGEGNDSRSVRQSPSRPQPSPRGEGGQGRGRVRDLRRFADRRSVTRACRPLVRGQPASALGGSGTLPRQRARCPRYRTRQLRKTKRGATFVSFRTLYISSPLRSKQFSSRALRTHAPNPPLAWSATE